MTEKYWRQVYEKESILQVKLDVHREFSFPPLNFAEIASQLLSLSGKERILDIGCGKGNILHDLRKKYHHQGTIVGLDVASTFNRGPAILFIQGNALRLPFADDSFEIITAFHVLSHFSQIRPLMQEIKRVIRPGGRFLATANSLLNYPHVSEYRKRVFSLYGWGEPVFTTTRFNAENADKILSEYWSYTFTTIATSELRIPLERFTPYFMANIPLWEKRPNSEEELRNIALLVQNWAQRDARNGFIIEPKSVSFTLCYD